MKTLKRDWWKVVLIIIASSFFNMILHGLLSPLNSSNISLGEPSIFVKKGMLVPAIICWELLTFGILSLVFVLIQSNIPGKRLTKGFLYGLSFGVLYIIGMFESVLLFNSRIYNEFLMGLADCISFVLAGILLGIFTGTDEMKKIKRDNIFAVFIIAFFYVIGRYLAYSVLHIQSAYIIKPLGTFIWTLGLGLWVGMIYFILQSGIKGKSIISRGLFFGIIVFGSNWLMNHLFIFAILEFSLDNLKRAGTDILFTIIGVCVYKSYMVKGNNL